MENAAPDGIQEEEVHDPEKILAIYRSFMEEVKIRTAAIDRYMERIAATKGGEDSFIDAESCILQVRYVCELIALAASSAHQMARIGSRLRKSWNAERTFALLEKVNIHCFPRTVRRSSTTANQFELQKGNMDLSELKAIYNACGENLHRGALKHFEDAERRGYDPEELLRWVNRIKALLSMHVVMLLDHGIIFLITMTDENGNVHAVFSQAEGPAILVEE